MSKIGSHDSFYQPTLLTEEWPKLRFVIPRHLATHLHWDIRIEANGILYSWWTLQPPSANPNRVIMLGHSGAHDSRYMVSERRIEDGMPGAGSTLVEDVGWVMPIPTSEDPNLGSSICSI